MLWCDIRAKDIILSPGVYTPGGLDKSLVQNMFYDVQQLLFVSLLAVASGVNLSRNGQSDQAIKLFQAPRKISFCLPFLTQVFHP